MTLAYLQNACTLNFNKNSKYNFQSIRKGMYAQIFFMFVLYFLSQLYQSVFFYREEGKTEEQPLTEKKEEEGQQSSRTSSRFVPAELPWHEKKWSKMFPILYGNHAVALALNLMFNPFASGLITAFIHLLFFGMYLAGSIRRMRVLLGASITGMAISNLVLIILGLVGVSANNFVSASSFDCLYK